MARFDLESLLLAIQDTLQNNLSAKLTEIGTEKGDSLTLSVPENAGYFIQELNGKAANYNPFVLILVDDIDSEGLGPATLDQPSIKIILAFADQNQTVDTYRQLFRYTRALKEVIEENWVNAQSGIKLRVSSLAPDLLKLANSSHLYRAVGIQIQAGMA